MNFDIQYTTFITFLNFYITCGIVFRSDAVPLSAIKHVEDEVMHKAKEMLRNGSFIGYEPERLALSLIKETRIKYRLEPWKKQLEVVSGYSAGQVSGIENSNILKPLNLLSSGELQNKEKGGNMSQNTTAMSLNSTAISLSLGEPKSRLCRKRMENTMKFQSIKENSMKVVHQTGLNSFRKPAFSSNKYPHNMSVSNSTERIVPLSSFVSRRA